MYSARITFDKAFTDMPKAPPLTALQQPKPNIPFRSTGDGKTWDLSATASPSTSRATNETSFIETKTSDIVINIPNRPSGAANTPVIANFQSLKGEQGVPEDVILAEEAINAAADRMDPNAPTREQERELLTAVSNYTRMANEIFHASKSPKAPANPSLKSAGTGWLTGMSRNLVTFTLPVGASLAAKHYALQGGMSDDQSTLLQKGVFTAAVALADMAMTPLGDKLRTSLGGNTTSIVFAGKKSGTFGEYKKIAGAAGDAIAGTVVYAAARAGMLYALSSSPSANVGIAAAKGMAAALTSGVVMNLMKEALYAGGAKATLARNDVSDAKDLPMMAHNRSLKSGIYMRETHGLANEGTTTQLVKKYGGAALGSALGGAALYLVDYALGFADLTKFNVSPEVNMPVRNMTGLQNMTALNGTLANPEGLNVGAVAGKEVVDVGLRFSTFFLVKAGVEAAWTKLVTDPDKHANAAAIADSEMAVRNLRASAMDGLKTLLDHTSKELTDTDDGSLGYADRVIKHHAQLTANVLSGDALASKLSVHTSDEDVRGAIRDLDSLKQVFNQVIDNLHQAQDKMSIRITQDMKRGLASLEALSSEVNDATNASGQGTRREPVLQPWLGDVKKRILDAQALLIMDQGIADENDTNLNARTAAMKHLSPLLIGIRDLNRRENAKSFIGKMIDFDIGNGSAENMLTALKATGHKAFSVNDVAHLITEQRQDPKEVNAASDKLVNGLSSKQQAQHAYALAKLDMIRGAIQPPPKHADKINLDDLNHSFTTFKNRPDDAAATQEAEVLRVSVRNGLLDAKTLMSEIRLLPEDQQETVFKYLGGGYTAALLDEHPETGNAPVVSAQVYAGMLEAIGGDVETMPKGHKTLFKAAASLSDKVLVTEPVRLGTIRQNDVHFHPTSYSGKITNLEHQVKFMDANGIERTNLAGIPSQVRKPTAEQKYYANSSKGIDYRDHDMPLAQQLVHLAENKPDVYDSLKDRVDLSMTGFDITSGATIGKDMDERLRMFLVKKEDGTFETPFKTVGEVTIKKEIISHKNPHNPHVESDDTQKLFTESFMRGLPIIAHCDRGKPGDKQSYEAKFISALEKSVRTVKGWHAATDPLKAAGIKDAPAPKPMAIWAHGGGISRFTVGSNTHTSRLDALLERPILRDALKVDLSWDFIAHDILRNTYDLFKEKDFPPRITDAIQNVLKSYAAFATEGSRADKASDIGDETLAAMHRKAGENIATLHMETLANFRALIRHEVQTNPEVREKLNQIINEHGDDGNNWLYVLNKHQDRMLFGTDALAVGIKSHGDAAYSLNTKMLYPIYDIFGAVAEANGAEDRVTPKIARENYVAFVDDPDNIARRQVHLKFLATQNASSWSTDASPRPYTTE